MNPTQNIHQGHWIAPRPITLPESEDPQAIEGFDYAEFYVENARQTAMYVFRELTDLSYPSIARLFGGRDHTTVIHAVDKIQRLMKERKQIYDQVTDLIQRLKSS
jgi:hypothetical protein